MGIFIWNGKVPRAAPSARAGESVMTVRETANASKDTRANRARSRTPWQHRATVGMLWYSARYACPCLDILLSEWTVHRHGSLSRTVPVDLPAPFLNSPEWAFLPGCQDHR